MNSSSSMARKRYFQSTLVNDLNVQPTNSKGINFKKFVEENDLRHYSRGENLVDYVDIKSKFRRLKEIQREKNVYMANRTAAKAEILLTGHNGYIELENDNQETFDLTQKEIINNLDCLTANKYFDLKLTEYGPYTIDYNRNGRELLLGGSKGHLAAIEWHTKNLKFEINVGESINCVRWLHTDTMLAVAQKKWVHVYDNTGIELHCLKKLYDIHAMQFLPYHFLLCCGSAKGFLSWLDISIGQIVAHLYTGTGRSACSAMTQNFQNAVIFTGTHDGFVKLWSPNCSLGTRNTNDSQNQEGQLLQQNEKASNVAKPLAQIWCHRSPIRAISCDPKGTYMATCDTDKNLHLWDLRTYKILDAFKLTGVPNKLAFSQNQLLSVSIGSRVEIYKDLFTNPASPNSGTGPYLIHKLNEPSTRITDLQYCPYEDVLGIGHAGGFTSIIVPGSGEANFDSFEANPYQSKSQRKEMEVKALLGKIQPELISLDTGNIHKVNVLTLQEKLEQRNKLLSLKPRRIDIRVKKRKAKKSASARRITARKQDLLSMRQTQYYNNLKDLNQFDKHASLSNVENNFEAANNNNEKWQTISYKRSKKVQVLDFVDTGKLSLNKESGTYLIPPALERFKKTLKRNIKQKR